MASPDPRPASVVVCDAGPLIHLDELDSLELLSDFAEVLVPARVWLEVERHRPSALSHADVVLYRVTVEPEESPGLEAIAKLFALDAGELEGLRIVRQRHADLLLTDDTAARLAANQLQIPVHGTIGVLVRAIRRRQMSAAEVVAVLRRLPQTSTLHIKQALLDEIIRQIEALG